MAEEWFQHIVHLAFTPAFLERWQDLPCVRKDLLGVFMASHPYSMEPVG
jgi:hypothetical protein